MLSVSSFMLAFSVSSIFAFNLKSFITILSHLSQVFISTLTCSSCLPMYPETLKPCLHIYSDILKSCLHSHTDTLKACRLRGSGGRMDKALGSNSSGTGSG